MTEIKVPASVVMLQVFAWLDLVAGIIGGLYVYATSGHEVISHITGLNEFPTYEHITNVYAIILAIGIFLQGIFLCTFFLVVSSIATNLVAIRNNTMPSA